VHKKLPDLPLTARQQTLAAENLAFVWWYAGKYAPQVPQGHPDREDLESRLVDAYVRACQLFDPARGNRFVTYAGVWLRSALSDFCRRKSLRETPTDPKMLGENLFAPEQDDPSDPAATRKLLGRLRRMAPREWWLILVMRSEGRTLQQVADHFGKSKERVRQIEAKAKERLQLRGKRLAESLVGESF
jgi:RNA polymerase sigma factor (sigma-70 family)